ncbi:MAG TPA: hypothetical protein VF490_20650, partial [Chryseosolibacter sp.]
MKRFSFLAGLLLLATGGFGQFIANNGIAISNSALLVTNGDWVNGAGTNLINNGIIRTSNSFVNSGGLDKASTGGFVLDFATDLSFQPGGSQLGFLTKNGAGRALLTGTIALKDSLLLNDGVIELQNPV